MSDNKTLADLYDELYEAEEKYEMEKKANKQTIRALWFITLLSAIIWVISMTSGWSWWTILTGSVTLILVIMTPLLQVGGGIGIGEAEAKVNAAQRKVNRKLLSEY